MFRRVSIALLCGTLLAACSEPPTKERQQADDALKAARAADAATYAPAALAAAEAALKSYDGAVADRDYRQALSFAIEARDQAYSASRTAADQKAAARSQAERLLSQYTQLLASAKTRLSATGAARLRPAAAERVRAAVRNGTSLLQESRALLDKGEFKEAVRRLQPAIQALQQDLAAPAGRSGRGLD